MSSIEPNTNNVVVAATDRGSEGIASNNVRHTRLTSRYVGLAKPSGMFAARYIRSICTIKEIDSCLLLARIWKVYASTSPSMVHSRNFHGLFV